MLHRLAGPAALLAAHPGHETLLHHWVERNRPVAFFLTDGSGGVGDARIEHSRQLLRAAGAVCGGVFGAAPDRIWYDDLLQCRADRFLATLDRLERECRARGVVTIMSDPIEHYNPMHDLANAVGRALAGRLSASGRQVATLTYPIELPDALPIQGRHSLALNTAAALRKGAAIEAYAPLAVEYPRYQALATADHELIALDDPGFSWPERLTDAPYYEVFGRARLRERRYGELITYAEHVRPMALAILRERRP